MIQPISRKTTGDREVAKDTAARRSTDKMEDDLAFNQSVENHCEASF